MWKIVPQTKVYFKCTLKLKNIFWGSRVVWILKSFQNKSILKVCFNYNLTSKYYSHQFSVLLLRTQLRSCKHFFRMVKYIAGFYNPGQKSSGQYCDIHIFLSFVGSLLKQCILFEIFLQFSPPPPTLYKVETWNKFRIHVSDIACGVRRGVGPVWIGKHHRKAKVSRDFGPWLSEKEVWRKRQFWGFFKPLRVFGILMKDSNWTNLFPAFRSFLNLL